MNGRVYGYVPGHRGIDISNLGAGRGVESIRGVTVVWMASEPTSRRKLIVGWYRDATVFKEPQPSPAGAKGRRVPGFGVSAAANKSTLVEPRFRAFEILSSRKYKGGFGQNALWYDRRRRYRQRVLNYLAAVEKGWSRRTAGKSPPRNIDPEARRIVEQIAVDHAWDYYEAQGYKMRTRERDRIGWDLEARKPGEATLLIEVKGLTNGMGSVELTPNEFDKFQKPELSKRYVLYVVANCRSGPLPLVFRCRENGRWETDDGQRADVQRKMGAIISLAPPA